MDHRSSCHRELSEGSGRRPVEAARVPLRTQPRRHARRESSVRTRAYRGGLVRADRWGGNDLRILRFAVDGLRRLAKTAGPVLVHCHAGRSRSAAIVAAYLMEERGVNALEAIAQVGARREINITPALVDLLRRLET
ncbi:dual specificity protein phosphatase family protein [Singulisphaera rosea]